MVGQPAPAGTGELSAVSCANARRCWAVGIAGPNPAPVAVGTTVIVATTNGGVSWRAEHVAGRSVPQLSGVSCPTVTRCMAVGSNGASLPGSGVVVTTTNAGSTWAPTTSPTNALAVTSVACTDSSSCTAIVSDGTLTWSAHSDDFGQSWQQEGGLPSLFLPGNGLTCVGSGSCLVAGYVPTNTGHGEGAVALTTDGGHTWALASVPAGMGLLQSTACLTASQCVVAGTTNTTVSDVVPAKGQLLRSADGGHSWQASALPVPVDDVFGVACPSAAQCAMVGTKWIGFPAVATGAVAQSVNGGVTFRASTAAYIPISLTALSCPTSSRCVAVGGDTVARLTLVTPKRAPKPSRPDRLPRR
jgi:photosystem II stability/assembly factor-like uncharacterized protein